MSGSALIVTARPSTVSLMLAMKPPLVHGSRERGPRYGEPSVDPAFGRRNCGTISLWFPRGGTVKASARETGIDFERFRLRRFVEELRQAGELEVRSGKFELADIAQGLEGNARRCSSKESERKALSS